MATTNVIITPPSGATVFTDSANANAAIAVKGSSATIYMLVMDNTANAAVSYVKLYNLTTAVTVGTTVPDMVFNIPASRSVTYNPVSDNGGGTVFGTGLQVATVTAGGTAGTTSPSSSVALRIVYA